MTGVSQRAEPLGSLEPFEEFFLRERDSLFRALVISTGSRDQAEEAVQEAFARVWARWSDVGIMENPVGYLHRTAFNFVHQSRRQLRRSLFLRLPRRYPSDVSETVVQSTALWQAVQTLPKRQRAALVLVELLGYDAASAGVVLGIQAGTVRTLIARAKRSLRGSSTMEDRA